MLQLIHAPIASLNQALPEVALTVERLTVAKRIWRGVAADGPRSCGFELERPLRHGETFWQSDRARYVIAQQPEAVVEISHRSSASSAAAGIGWAVGNLHLELKRGARRGCSRPTSRLCASCSAACMCRSRPRRPFFARAVSPVALPPMSSDPAINTKGKRVDPNALPAKAPWGQGAPPDAMAAWIVGLLQAGDSFYPTGSYAHSFGLEGLVQEGVVQGPARH